ncbi:peptidase M15B and M15C DD-carboxypeptidase VanY/endolysin [Paenibacillus curdlanolyticus YK9]|uniref:Peptidase M15B and M15C DD-carboxypeptidase VanY/endolysin n=1 Tax=Paenibacillus curdlanolyticus YK9 TaxID=717606 RepID=E0IA47_9BACL|nr:M15 family metallopeptidase [Paenibacillus curdlanolyticus]EFM10624.1 peptidase M15B and M15C DD-carboxypeptidase VanY/endolysin [Paenibacillus curdlanolyticus YK9]
MRRYHLLLFIGAVIVIAAAINMYTKHDEPASGSPRVEETAGNTPTAESGATPDSAGEPSGQTDTSNADDDADKDDGSNATADADANIDSNSDQEKADPPKDQTADAQQPASADDEAMTTCLLYVSKDPASALADTFVPKDLVEVNVPTAYDIKGEHVKELSKDDQNSLYNEKLMVKEAADALEKLFAAAKKDKMELYAYSGYRSYTTQELVYQRNVKRLGKEEADRVSAIPGHSEHQTGLTMDITSKALMDIYSKNKDKSPLIKDFGQDPEGIWLKEHAHEYGFIMSYPEDKEAVTGYSYEPWHYRYVGVEAAANMHEAGQTLGEYVAGGCKPSKQK